MTLTTHAIVGALAAQFFPQYPAAAFAAGFASHFVIDALPHWDYSLRSSREHADPLQFDLEIGRDFVHDIVKIGFDAILGLFLSCVIAYLFDLSLILAVIGACAGIFPDALQFVYFKTHLKLLRSLQRFHIWIQEGRQLHIAAWKGISLQGALVIVLICVVKAVL